MISAIAAVETGFVEQRLLAAFSALENVHWTLLVLGGDITEREFKDMRGADRLKAALEKAEISPVSMGSIFGPCKFCGLIQIGGRSDGLG